MNNMEAFEGSDLSVEELATVSGGTSDLGACAIGAASAVAKGGNAIDALIGCVLAVAANHLNPK